MKAKISAIFDNPSQPSYFSPVNKFKIFIVFELETGGAVFGIDSFDYVNRLKMSSPLNSKGFLDIANEGMECEISYQEVNGEKIVDDLNWM
jgi:hypothetical protein